MSSTYTFSDAQQWMAKIAPLAEHINVLAKEEADTIDNLLMTMLLQLSITAFVSIGGKDTATLTGALKTAFYLGYQLAKSESPDPDVWQIHEGVPND